jgi:hypothetical protein
LPHHARDSRRKKRPVRIPGNLVVAIRNWSVNDHRIDTVGKHRRIGKRRSIDDVFRIEDHEIAEIYD